MTGETLGHYEIQRRIGAGGMGMVYAATDTRLERPVAIKVIHEGLESDDLRERFWREAKAAAAIQHPGVCQVYEVGEEAGRLFIVMELLQGQTLEDRLAYGALDLDEALRITLALLDTLAVLHRRKLLHRDIKPSNVFLLDDGRSKLLDFGLVRPAQHPAGGDLDATALTRPGMGVGTPGYMSPEQVLGKPLDARSDLFSVGVVLYEAATGERPFKGDNAIEIMNAALKETPAPLRGSPLHEAVGAVLQRAMAREPAHRPADAEAMARDLRALRGRSISSATIATPAGATRLAVLPFQMLRPDPEHDFLGPALADAITLSLTGIESLVVRSTLATGRFAGGAADLESVARSLDVDVVLSGTLLAAGNRCRATAQLVEAPSGRIRWTETVDVSSKDIFELQDSLTRKLVDSLQLPLTERERGGLQHDVPASPSGYELFLRANELANTEANPPMARDLYVRALEADPHFAPAWTRLAYCYRLLGKYYPQDRKGNFDRAAEALRRAFELREDFPAASLVQAQIDLDLGRTEPALEDLLCLVERNANDVTGFVGLVTALRFAGMLNESLLAHERVRQLDPNTRTSVEWTHLLLRDYERAVAATGAPGLMPANVALMEGDREAALRTLRSMERLPAGYERRADLPLMLGALEGKPEDLERLTALFSDFPDPEGRFQGVLFLILVKDETTALEWIETVVDGGFFGVFATEVPGLAPLMRHATIQTVAQRARRRMDEVEARFGERVRSVLPSSRP